MSTRQFGATLVVLLCSVGVSGAQEMASLDTPTRWNAPPYWSAPAKPAGPKGPHLGTLDAEAADVVPSPPMPFVAINPCRIADTRGNGFTGQAGPPILAVAVTRVFQIGGTVAGVPTQCGIPLAAQAVSFQFTVTGMNSGGNLIAWPDGVPPTTSVLNWNAGSVAIGSGTVVPLSATGGVRVQVNGLAGATTHLIIDVNGYYAPSPAWSLTGNSGTTPGTHFLGTTDDQALELKVNGDRGLRIEPLPATNTWGPNVIGGFAGNFVTGGKVGATIGGGGQTGAAFVNRVTGDFGTVGGGWGNAAEGYAAVVDGGRGNAASGHQSSLGGGQDNTSSGDFASIPGGLNNVAGGSYSFAAGRRAKANHTGSFVWGDSTDADVASTTNDQFVVRATGGARFILNSGVVCTLDATGWNCTTPSDRNAKKSLLPVDGRETLERLAALPIQTWSYIDHHPSARHMGPMAQDFAAAFGLGTDDKTINPLDANGVALAAIQALYEEVRVLRKRLEELEAERD